MADAAPSCAHPRGRGAGAWSLRFALNEGGVTFVKLGQILLTRRDLLSHEFIDDLGQLQYQASQVPWDQIELMLRENLDGEVDEFFATLDRKPLAASIAQVHALRLATGEEVVVKVRRPGITLQRERTGAVAPHLRAGQSDRRQRRTARLS